MKATMTTWPKNPPLLSEVQEQVRKEWEAHWLGQGVKKFSFVEKFNHKFLTSLPLQHGNLLEIGPGRDPIGKDFVKLENYFCLELREDFAQKLRNKFSFQNVLVGDVQKGIPIQDHFFDRIIAVHVLEHLRNLPAALKEIHRVLRPSGVFDIILPCEGSILYTLGRKFSSEAEYKRKFKRNDFKILIANEHVNKLKEIVAELQDLFVIEKQTYWPLQAPVIDINLLSGFRLRAKNKKQI